MSSLRETIDATIRDSTSTVPLTDAILSVVEAMLREHDAQTRQRIEALPGVITGMEYVHGVREGNPAIVMRADVLEALRGGDE